MKKPQALIGLLAALGTAIGVLVAVVGLPYGRMNYSAFAEVYHNGTNTTGMITMAIDCDVVTPGTQEDCNYDPSALPAGMQVDITLGNETGTDVAHVTAFAIYVNNPDSKKFGHVYKVAAPTGYDGNPDYNGVNPGTDATDTTPPPDVVGGFACGSPAPGDTGGSPATINKSTLLCNDGNPTDGPTILTGNPVHLVLARLSYSFADTCSDPDPSCAGVQASNAANGDNVPLTLSDMVVFDDSFSEVGSCNPVVSTQGFCGSATIHFIVPPTTVPTDTPTATNTVPATDTPTNTATATATNTPEPVSASGLIKVPESCGIDASNGVVSSQDPDNCVANSGGTGFSSANLWLCTDNPNTIAVECTGPGEGNLIVFEYGVNIASDYDNDGVRDAIDPDIAGTGLSNTELGLGAYEFQVEYDNNVIQSVNPCDVAFSATSTDTNNPGGADGILDPAGAARGNVDEIDGLNNPYCTPDAGLVTNNGNCTASFILENLVRFGCVTKGQAQGPSGNFDVAAINLIPHPDLNNDIFPGNNNGVITVLKDNGCETADRLGHPTLNDVNGGLNQLCTDVAVTVRILEGDINLDCTVDVTDAQAIATHYGGFFGSLLYSKWLDLEPATHDLDIDIKDLQKVFGRIGSNCQDPIPQQLPAGFPTTPGN